MPALYAECRLRVPFHDLDPMDIVWHGNYVKYFEQVRHELLIGLDYDYPQMRDSGYSWPIVDLQVRYRQSARFGQWLLLRADIVEWENRLKIRYQIRDADSGQILCTGSTLQVAVQLSDQSLCFVCPPILWQKLGIELPEEYRR